MANQEYDLPPVQAELQRLGALVKEKDEMIYAQREVEKDLRKAVQSHKDRAAFFQSKLTTVVRRKDEEIKKMHEAHSSQLEHVRTAHAIQINDLANNEASLKNDIQSGEQKLNLVAQELESLQSMSKQTIDKLLADNAALAKEAQQNEELFIESEEENERLIELVEKQLREIEELKQWLPVPDRGMDPVPPWEEFGVWQAWRSSPGFFPGGNRSVEYEHERYVPWKPEPLDGVLPEGKSWYLIANTEAGIRVTRVVSIGGADRWCAQLHEEHSRVNIFPHAIDCRNIHHAKDVARHWVERQVMSVDIPRYLEAKFK